MASWLETSDPLVSDLNASNLEALCDGAVGIVEKFCRRRFDAHQLDHVYTVTQDGTIILKNPPITDILRVCDNIVGMLTLHCTNPIANYYVAETELRLRENNRGILDNSLFPFVAEGENPGFPTLLDLKDGVSELDNWSAELASDCTDYPSTDLVFPQFGNIGAGQSSIYCWRDYTGQFDFDFQLGILTGFIGFSQEQIRTISPNVGYGIGGFPRWSKVRVVSQNGFDEIPAEIKEATAQLVRWAAKGRIKSENIGGYSYTLDDLQNLPLQNQQVLSQWRDRSV